MGVGDGGISRAGRARRETSGHDLHFIASVVERWRTATVCQNGNTGEAPRDAKLIVGSAGIPAQPVPQPSPSRLNLLKKPSTGQPDPFSALKASLAMPTKR